jgi:phage repressor protein C with HTH and peptisase S24 domain
MNPWVTFIEQLFRDFRLSTYKIEKNYGLKGFSSKLSSLRSGRTVSLSQDTISDLEKALDIKIDDSNPDLITYRKINHNQPKFDDTLTVFEYPVLSEVFAGEPDKIDIEFFETKEPFPYHRRGHNCFALRVNGKSMETTLRDGDVVLVDMSLEPMNGDLVAVKLNNGNQYIKRYYKINDYFIKLTSDNSEYGVKVIDTKDILAVHPVVSVNFNIRNAERNK